MSVEVYTIPRFNTHPRPYTIFLGMPMGSSNVKIGAAEGWGIFPSSYEEKPYNILHAKSMGGITHENLVCEAINRKSTHISIIHTDVCPPWYWLDYLWSLMEAADADFIGVNISHRDKSKRSTIGISTRIAAAGGRDIVRRLPLEEVERQPEPFSHVDLDPSGNSALCCSTGLFLCNLRKQMIRDLVWMGEYERIRADDGSLHPHFRSEDYICTLRMSRMPGVKILMSKGMNIGHEGDYMYKSVVARGEVL